jgi:O-antigen ligase
VGHFLSEDPQRPFLADFNHFHSTYVEILLRTGLIGALFYLVAAGFVLAAIRSAVREGRMPRGLRDFLLISLGIFLALSATNSILFFQQGWHFIVLFGGLAYGYRWAPRSPERNSP